MRHGAAVVDNHSLASPVGELRIGKGTEVGSKHGYSGYSSI